MTLPRAADLLAVFLGGVTGTALRWSVDLLVPHDPDAFPVGTLIINVLGSVVLGALVGGLWDRVRSRTVRAAIGPGLLGTFTTFSAVALSAVTMTAAGAATAALAYLAATLVLGVASAAAGIAIGRRLTGTPGREDAS